MANKPKWSPTNTYILFIVLSCTIVIVSAWLELWRVTVTAAAVSIVFVSLQLGSIFHQYAGIIQLIQILNGVIVASLRAQGFEFEGQAMPQPEDEVAQVGI